jgi:hypothetical protein
VYIHLKADRLNFGIMYRQKIGNLIHEDSC